MIIIEEGRILEGRDVRKNMMDDISIRDIDVIPSMVNDDD